MTRDERNAMGSFTGRGVWAPGHIALMLTLLFERPVTVEEVLALVKEYNGEAEPAESWQSVERAKEPFWRGTR